MRSFALFSLIYLPLVTLAGTSNLSPYVVHEKRTGIPHGWTKRSKPDVILPLRFGLSQLNIKDIDQHLNAVSHPESPHYGQHWSADKVAATFAPSQETIDVVSGWLASQLGHKRVRLTKSKGWLELDATVEEAERLLQTTYSVYEHESGAEHIACESYQLPAHIQPHVDLVTPTIHFNAILGKRSPAENHLSKRYGGLGQPSSGPVSPQPGSIISNIFTELEHCDKQITPACLRALYNLDYVPIATEKNSYGIVEYTPQAVLQSDINLFAQNFSSSLKDKFPKLVSIDGGIIQTENSGFDFNGEADLDIQYGMALVEPQEVTLYQVGDTVEGGSFNNLLDALDGSYCTSGGGDDPSQDGIYPDTQPNGYNKPEDCGIVEPANVISTSYGYNEADLSLAYATRQCNEYAKLGLLGVTIVYSSGDFGVAGNGNICLDPNGEQDASGKIFNPSFPSTCPYVTSVGATQVNPNSSVSAPESACEQVIYSGGGFSNYFGIPDYQRGAVDDFLKDHPPPYDKSLYNSTGTSRAYPDISANGANYVVAIAGQFQLVYGTSASAPVVGSILTLINDARLAVGKSSIGFINPTIYHPNFQCAWNDITSGGNQGCGTAGFTATNGWDPVTGLGTPNFPKLLARWLALP